MARTIGGLAAQVNLKTVKVVDGIVSALRLVRRKQPSERATS
jgi:hypothetical protein